MGPFGDSEMEENVDGINAYHHSHGLSSAYLIVHVGYAMTAIRLADGRWMTLNKVTYEEMLEYDSLDGWYRRVLRAEYAARYGLPILSST